MTIGDERSAADLARERLAAWFADVDIANREVTSYDCAMAAWATLVAERADDLDLPPGVG